MEETTFVEQEIAAGSHIHRHQGVWWQKIAPGVCRPVLPLRQLRPGEARPRLAQALVGYAHLVPSGTPSYASANLWLMDEPRLRSYGLANVKAEKRKAVLRATRSGLHVVRISDIEPYWLDLQHIAASMAARTGYGRPPLYYREHFPEWQRTMRMEFAKPLREWWGVFAGETLAGYQYAYQIEETMYLRAAKVATEYLRDHASDLLYFSFLEYCRGLETCKRVDAGRGTDAEGVNRFKEAQGFERCEVGEYFKYNVLISAGLRLLLRLHTQHRQGNSDENDGEGSSSFRSRHRDAIRMARRIE